MALLVVLTLTMASSLFAQKQTRDTGLNDPLLDRLIGDWSVQRKFANGRAAKSTTHAEWVLKHHFVQLHYGGAVKRSAYEAIVLIGYDDVKKSYICHWADTFGGAYSGDGFAPRNEGSNVMVFEFQDPDGGIENRYEFDQQSGSWTSTIRQMENGEWKLFCRDKFVSTTQESRASTTNAVLTFYVISEKRIEGGRFIDTPAIPKAGYIAAKPDLTISTLRDVYHANSDGTSIMKDSPACGSGSAPARVSSLIAVSGSFSASNHESAMPRRSSPRNRLASPGRNSLPIRTPGSRPLAVPTK
jgi:hypothetical protein